jgi:hypothetical protein
MNLSKKIILIFILISLLVQIYVLYKDFIFFDGQRNYNHIHYTLVGAIFLLIIGFNLNENIRKNSILIIFSTLIALYSIEIFILTNLKIKLSKYLENGFDKRTRYEAYIDMRKENKNIYPAAFPSNFIYKQISNKSELVPFGNISNKEILWCNENGYYSVHNSDQYGFRNPDNGIWQQNFIEYTLIGDSYTEGACVNDQDTIAGNLSVFSKKNVLNLGRGGNGPLSKLAILYEYSKLKNGSKVIWFYYEGNDIKDMIEEKNSEILNKYFDNKNYRQNLKSKQKIIDQLLIEYTEEIIKTKQNEIDHALGEYSPFKVIKLYNLRYYFSNIIKNLLTKNNNKFNSNDFELYLDIIKKAKEFSNENNAKFYLVYLPSYNRYSENYNLNNYMNKENLLKLLKKNHINIIDIDSLVFNKEKDVFSLFPLRKSGHYNEKGYQKVAEAIVEYFKLNSN